jgi:Invasion associated locus B (IalB) protein
MRVHRGLAFFLSLLIVCAFAVSARAQQPAEPPAAPRPAPKPKPHMPAAPAAPKPAAPAAPVAGPAKPTLLGQYGGWGAYTATPNGRKVCFAIAKPTTAETKPPDRPRNEPYMFISTRPTDKVSNEVSIVVGYPFKSVEATAQVGGTTFQLYTQGDGAWIKNAAEEAHMIEAMRTGDSAVVKGTSAKGTESTDTYSLKGLTEALDRVAQECK